MSRHIRVTDVVAHDMRLKLHIRSYGGDLRGMSLSLAARNAQMGSAALLPWRKRRRAPEAVTQRR